MEIQQAELFDLYEEGEHVVTCLHCDHDFTVSTEVTYTFTSPALEKELEEDFEEDPEDE